MARIHFFELMDQSWFPTIFRDYMTDYLEFVTDKFDLYKNIQPTLEEGLAKAEKRQIVDIGSGGGGGMVKICERFRENNAPVDVLLTDFYPNVKAFEKVSATDEHLSFHKESVDARNVPNSLKGLRTMFLAFHHFKPKDATQILKNAVDTKQPFVSFEMYQVTVKDIIGPILAPLFVLFLTPFIRPFRLGRIIFTYLIPIIPLVIMFDGIVSVLRSYSPKELKTLLKDADPNNEFDWDIGQIPAGGGATIHYILGTPK